MTVLEDILSGIEQHEEDTDMHFSLFSIPYYYNEEDTQYAD